MSQPMRPQPFPRHEPGRLEPFIAVSLLMHLLLALLLARWMEFPRVRLSMAQGGVVQVFAVPMPAGSPAGQRLSGSASGEGTPSPQGQKPAAARVIAERPQRPAQPRAKGPAESGPVGRKEPAPQQPAKGPKAVQSVLTSERNPVATVSATPGPEPRGEAGQGTGPAEHAPGGGVSDSGSEGTGGARAGSPGSGAFGPVPASAVVPQGGIAPPSYPKNALSQGLEGRVVLRLTVGADGVVQGADIQESSGRADFDAVAARFARLVRFQRSPAGVPYRLAVEFVFSLERDAQGRVDPVVEVRPLGHVEFVGTAGRPRPGA